MAATKVEPKKMVPKKELPVPDVPKGIKADPIKAWGSLKATVAQRDLLEAVSKVIPFVATRPAMPVLACMSLEIKDGWLEVSSFDYEVSSKWRVALTPGTEWMEGRVLVAARLFSSVSKKALKKTGTPAYLSTEEGKGEATLLLSAGSTVMRLTQVNQADAPNFPEIGAGDWLADLGDGVLADTVKFSTIAAGRDDTLPTLTGMRLEFENDTLVTACTDRYRLAVDERMIRADRTPVEILVPARTMTQVVKLLGDQSVSIWVKRGKGSPGKKAVDDKPAIPARLGEIEYVSFIGASRSGITTRLIDGDFPKYRALLPSTSEFSARVDVDSMIEAVQAAAEVAERNTPVALAFSKDGVVVSARGDGGESSAEVSLDGGLDGEPLTVAYNPQYLLDGLKAVGGPIVQIEGTSATKPAVFSNPSGPSGKYLLMPVRISG